MAWRTLKEELVGYASDGKEIHYCEFGGPSGEDKPTTGAGGAYISEMSIACESDTGVVFFHNETSGWVEQFSFQPEE